MRKCAYARKQPDCTCLYTYEHFTIQVYEHRFTKYTCISIDICKTYYLENHNKNSNYLLPLMINWPFSINKIKDMRRIYY